MSVVFFAVLERYGEVATGITANKGNAIWKHTWVDTSGAGVGVAVITIENKILIKLPAWYNSGNLFKMTSTAEKRVQSLKNVCHWVIVTCTVDGCAAFSTGAYTGPTYQELVCEPPDRFSVLFLQCLFKYMDIVKLLFLSTKSKLKMFLMPSQPSKGNPNCMYTQVWEGSSPDLTWGLFQWADLKCIAANVFYKHPGQSVEVCLLGKH